MQLDEAISRVAQLRLRFFRTSKRYGDAERRAGERLSKTLANLQADIQALTLVKNAAMAHEEFQRKLRKHLDNLPKIMEPHLLNWRVHYTYSNMGLTGPRRAFLHAQIDVTAGSRRDAVSLVQALCKKERRVFRRVIQAKRTQRTRYPADIALAS